MNRASDDDTKLGSWKEIADFIGVTVRTAQKWEEQRGLPVKRTAGVKGRVWADRDELIQWRETALRKPRWKNNPTVLRLYAVAVTILLVVCGGIVLVMLLLRGSVRQPAVGRVEGDYLIISDDNGREIWRKSFDMPLDASAYVAPDISRTPKIRFVDLVGDGNKEVLFFLYGTSFNTGSLALICFSADGAERWRYVPDKTVRIGDRTVGPPFQIQQFDLVRVGDSKEWAVVVSSRCLNDYPNQVALLDARGRVLREYWHSGGLNRLVIGDMDHNGRSEIYLGGVSNQHKQATLIVLDPETMEGASVEEDPAYQIQGLKPGREIARILFPRSCINKAVHPYNRVNELDILGDSLNVRVVEYDATLADAIYTLDRNFNVLRFVWCDGLRSIHRQLEAAGKLNHAYTAAEEAEMGHIRFVQGPKSR